MCQQKPSVFTPCVRQQHQYKWPKCVVFSVPSNSAAVSVSPHPFHLKQ